MSIPAVREARVAPPTVTTTPAARSSAPHTSPSPSTSEASTEPSPFARLMRGLGHEVQRSETVVHQAIASARGGQLGPGELIALQAGVYRYSEAVDLAARLVDHATSALKTVVQGQ